jgi:uncharacterized protein (TIGR03067 family)
MVRIALVAIFLSGVAVAAPVPKAVKAKAPAFDGVWELVQQNNNNSEVPKISPWKWEIAGEELYRHWGNGDGTFRRETQNCWLVRPKDGGPDDVDYVTGHDRQSATYTARAVVEGDEMTVCWTDGNRGRPADLKPGPGVNYYRFKRVSDK